MDKEGELELISNSLGGDTLAFQKLLKEYTPEVTKVVMYQLTRGGLHHSLSIHYKQVIEDIVSEAWFRFYTTQSKGKLSFSSVPQFKSYLRLVAQRTAFKFMSERIENRTPSDEQEEAIASEQVDDRSIDSLIEDRRIETGINKKNLLFSSIDELEGFDTNETLTPESVALCRERASAILEKLSEDELKALQLTLSEQDQQDVANAMGVSVRTVFNKIRSIEEKSKRYEDD